MNSAQLKIKPKSKKPHQLHQLHRTFKDGLHNFHVSSHSSTSCLSPFYSAGPVFGLGAPIQAKLKIGQPNDKYEQEADRVADQVMSISEQQVQRQSLEEEEEELVQPKLVTSAESIIQRQVEEEGEEELLQTDKDSAPTAKITPDLESKIQSQRGFGRPLSGSERSFFEPRFGVDLSGVRLHADHHSMRTAKSINARAFTVGQDIYFSQVNRDFSSSEGSKLFAHELTHTIQQNSRNIGSSRTSGTSAPRITPHIQNKPGNLIQRWGLGDHKILTEKVVNKFFSHLSGNKRVVEKLKNYSKDMDIRFQAICFNLPAVLIGSHESLVEHYAGKESEAKNHGEGGLYMHDIATARWANLSRQTYYEDKARRAWRTIQRTFGSISECEKTRDSEGQSTLEALGYALHVAQDRGAHGEGAIGYGHDRKDFEPDNPSVNTEGWKQAESNTEILMLNAFEILDKILNERWWRICSSKRTAKARIKGKK